MLKKLLIITPLAVLGLALFWVWNRLEANPAGVFPTPYKFPKAQDKIAVDAPLLIVGDRMANRLGLFKETLSLEISTGLSKPLKTGVLAGENMGIHRTIRQLENLEKWPKIMLYTGGSQELTEEKFLTKEISTIRTNFARYQDDVWRSVMMVWPESSRLIYEPLERLVLKESPEAMTRELSETEYQARLELSYRLYEIELNRLIELTKSKGVVLILATTPVNLDIPPKTTCEITRTPEIAKGLADVRELLRKQDVKAAYPKSLELSQTSMANAEVYYLHGQVAHRVGRREEAIETLRKAAAFDCQSWRSNEVTNNIIRKVAREQRVTLFDFDRMVEADWNKNTTFFNEIYPQDLYYEKACRALATVLRRMLKL